MVCVRLHFDILRTAMEVFGLAQIIPTKILELIEAQATLKTAQDNFFKKFASNQSQRKKRRTTETVKKSALINSFLTEISLQHRAPLLSPVHTSYLR